MEKKETIRRERVRNRESVGQAVLVVGADEPEILREYLVPLLHLFLALVTLPEPAHEPSKLQRTPALPDHPNHLRLHARHHSYRVRRLLHPRRTGRGA